MSTSATMVTIPSVQLTLDELLALSGAEEGIFLLMNALLKTGDHIIVQYPCYQSLYEIAQSIGCRISKWKLHEKKAEWLLNIEEFCLLLKS